MWTQPGLVLRDEYLDVLTGAYGSPLAEVDFGTPPGAARELINGWIADETSGLIPELFPDRSFDASTRMVLVNAVAMDAPWEFSFDPAATGPGPFALIDGTSANVPMMHYDEYLPSLWTENLQAVELPYGGGALSMVVIAPTDLAAFEADLTAESVAAVIDQIQDGGIHLSMPKWTARTHAQLNDTLSTLGMPTAFSGSSAASPTREPHPDTFRLACTHARYKIPDAVEPTRTTPAIANIQRGGRRHEHVQPDQRESVDGLETRIERRPESHVRIAQIAALMHRRGVPVSKGEQRPRELRESLGARWRFAGGSRSRSCWVGRRPRTRRRHCTARPVPTRASRSRLGPFVKAARTMRDRRGIIVNAINEWIGNGRVEGNITKVRLIIRRSYGFHSATAALALVMLACGPINLTLPHEQPPQRAA